MMLVDTQMMAELLNALGGATMAFAGSAGISYFAQRIRKKWVEKASDLLFMVGILLIFYVSLLKMGVIA